MSVTRNFIFTYVKPTGFSQRTFQISHWAPSKYYSNYIIVIFFPQKPFLPLMKCKPAIQGDTGTFQPVPLKGILPSLNAIKADLSFIKNRLTTGRYNHSRVHPWFLVQLKFPLWLNEYTKDAWLFSKWEWAKVFKIWVMWHQSFRLLKLAFRCWIEGSLCVCVCTHKHTYIILAV